MQEPDRERLRAMGELLDGIDVAFCAFDRDDRAIAWNRTFLRLFPEHDGFVHEGESYADNLRRFYAIRLAGDELARIDDYIAAGIARHRSQYRPYEFEHRGMRLAVSSQEWGEGARVRVWRVLEQASRDEAPLPLLLADDSPDSRARLLDQMPDGIMISGGDGRIQWANESFAAIYRLTDRSTAAGMTLEEVYRAAWRDVGAAEAERFQAGLDTLTENQRFTGAPFELPLPNRRACRIIARRGAGANLLAHVDVSELRRQQHLLAVANREIEKARQALQNSNTELARHRENLEGLVDERTRDLARARDEAESASRAKSAFLAGASHELRTPMNHIIGFSHLLERQLQGDRPRAQLARIQESSRHLLALINDILDYSRIEAEEIRLESIGFDVGNLLACAEEDVKDLASAKGLAVTRTVDPALPARLVGDPVRIGQVLENLLANAVKFSEHGAVRLTARLEARHAGAATVRFAVSDEGIGVPEVVRDQLFKPFSQVDGSSTRRHGGVGLGLALCRRLVNLMAGTFGVESTPGSGSTFWFQLRLPQAEPLAGETRPREVAAYLESLLAQGDIKAHTLWLQSRQEIRALLGAQEADFGRAMAAFQFEAALALLRDALAEER